MKNLLIAFLGFFAILHFSNLHIYAAPITPVDFVRTSPSPPFSQPDTVTPTTSLTKGSITWTFSKLVEYGQFANGDFFVIDTGSGLKITNISPGHKVIGGKDRNGSMLNPKPAAAQGYDARAYKYDASLNVGIGVSPSKPLTIVAGDMLISTTNRESDSNRSYVDEAYIITVLSSPPPAGSFRPGYCDTERKIYNKSELDYSKLASLPAVKTAPTLESIEQQFKGVWLEHQNGWYNRFAHPANNMPDYGREWSIQTGEAGLMLNLDFPNDKKEKLLIYFVQLGIDLYSIAKNPGTNSKWANDGGVFQGRKMPIMFAAIVLNNSEMKKFFSRTGDYLNSNGRGPGNPPSDYFHFQEDDQTYYVSQYDVTITTRPKNDGYGKSCNTSTQWCPDDRGGTCHPYTTSMLGMPEWSIRHSNQAYMSDSAWHTNYRRGSNGSYWTGFVLTAHIMEMRTLWNHEALFDYFDRYIAISKGNADPFGYKVPGEAQGYAPNGFEGDMWNKYRSNFK